jgi:DNA-3-methyladenine glycosylase
MILLRTFYEMDTIAVAKSLLGKTLVHETSEGTTAGKIVETEAYRGPEDKAAHSFGGRKTARSEVMFGPKGHAYVYFIYGMYYCFNITSGSIPGKPEAVLIRALEPVNGEDIMAKRRGKSVNLSNGPGRLCMAMGISRDQNKMNLSARPFYILNASGIPSELIVETTRVGVDYADEWKNKPWRFYIRGNRFVSVT